MVKFLLYLFLFIVFCSEDVLCKKRGHKQENGGKIVGGTETTIEQYPYQAYLLLSDGKDYYQCGGFIISQNYIVTAAHCLIGMSQISVRIGSTQSSSGGLEYKSTRFYSHLLYNARTSDYDIGVVRVNQNMTLDGTNARAIPMVNSGSDVMDGQNVTLTGWGATSEGGATSSDLMVVRVPAVGRSECRRLLGNGITERMFCAGIPEGGKDTCQGDSGGPAVVNDLAAGVVSFGYGCARPNSPGVYTRIGDPMIRSFIKRRTGI